MTLETTPLPYFRVMIVSIGLFCNSFISTVILPFLTFMVSDFKVAPKPEDIGRYSGYLVSSFMLGQLLFSYFWGYMSDRYGRKPIIILGLASTGLSFLAFGFSKSYALAIALRFFSGAMNGIVGVTKTYMSEITDETNQSQGFAIMGVNRAIGMILGPIVGGFLCNPAQKYPYLFPKDSFFDIYPYALPCMFGFLAAEFGAIAGSIVLEETRVVKRPEVEDEEERLMSPTRKLSGQESNSDVSSWLTPTSPSSPKPNFSLLNGDIANAPTPMHVLLRQPRVYMSLALFMLVSAQMIQFDELFVLWSRMPRVSGGIAFTSSDQGMAFTIGGISLLIFQAFMYAPIERALGCLKTFQVGLLITIPAFIFLPVSALLYDEQNPNKYRLFMWVFVGIAHVAKTIGGIQAFTSCYIFIANSCTSKSRGSINGLGQTIGAFGRMVGPVFAGNIFSFSLQNNWGWFFNQHLLFYVLILFISATLAFSFHMPESINKRLPEPQEAEHVEIEED